MLLAQLAETGRIDLVGDVSHGEGDVACIIPAGILRKGFDDVALVVDDLVARAVEVDIPAGRVVQLVVAELRTLAVELVVCHGNPLPKQRKLYTLYAMARVVSRGRHLRQVAEELRPNAPRSLYLARGAVRISFTFMGIIEAMSKASRR